MLFLWPNYLDGLGVSQVHQDLVCWTVKAIVMEEPVLVAWLRPKWQGAVMERVGEWISIQ